MAEATGVLIVGQTAGDDLSLTSRELLTAGRKVADDLGEELSISLLGQSVELSAQQALQNGADRVYAVTNPLLEEYQVDLYLSAIETLCREGESEHNFDRAHRRRKGTGSEACLSVGRGFGPGLP